MAVSQQEIIDDRYILTGLGRMLERNFIHSNLTVRDFLMVLLLKIRDKSGNEVPFVLNHGQRELAAGWGRKNIVLKARQLGISTYVAARYFIDTITRPGTLTVQVAHDQRSAEDIFRIVHRFQEKLPVGLREGVLKTSRSNVRQLVWPHLDGEYRVETAADPNAGRGMTIRNLHCSEVAMWSRDGEEALVSLRAAVPPDGQVVLESTPRGAGGMFYEEWHAAAETGYIQHFLPWWVEKGYRRDGLAVANLTDEEYQLAIDHDLDDAQIAYRREIRSNCRGKALQEYAEDPESCFLLSGDCVFDIEKVDQRLKECEVTKDDNISLTSRDNGRELIWLNPMPGRDYIIGVDTAGGGVNGDYACAQVIDRDTGKQCAELHGHLTPEETAVRVTALANEYNQAVVAIERNNHGEAVWYLMREYPKLYENFTEDRKGFQTNVSTKPRVITLLGQLLREAPELFSSARFLRECRTYLRQNDGSTNAAAGAHDDTVMAMAIAQYVRQELTGIHIGCVARTTLSASSCEVASTSGEYGPQPCVDPGRAATERLLALGVSPG